MAGYFSIDFDSFSPISKPSSPIYRTIPPIQRDHPNPDKPEPNRKAKRESCSTGRDPKVPYTSQRLENEVSIKLPQEEVATFPQKYFSTGDIKLILRV